MNNLFCGLVVFAAIVIAVAVYLLVMTGCCADRTWLRPTRTAEEERPDPPKLELSQLSTCKYKKGTETAETTPNTDCVVCLSDFEDDECVRQFPECRHSFHAPCIDKWLYSHSDCPLCRTPLSQPGSSNRESSLSHRASSVDERSIDSLQDVTISSPALSSWSLASHSNLLLL